ncbi:hypothetical protein EIN_079420 [Entamoeba invadens IP1]|uniref:hypothetical protein n=1 Tax=Entamoeba invadens IP1 TaxID=370355 RepID=UPI0002C3F630|nr:hypothetical protein EIN_079420 [Entamoeba invadens IP1]ELP85020.1 hypothetical protein EIN_079420 [Entamoeba invadens IP1]|eukprot:XP_004184366.1 hypothetical protein EIN_079420 [Entamoeba invadens IP1]
MAQKDKKCLNKNTKKVRAMSTNYNEDKCPTTRHLIELMKQPHASDLNLYDNHKKMLLSICEYLVDTGVTTDLYEQCINQQIFLDCDVSQALHNKRSLAFVLQFFECVEPPYCEVDNLPKVIASVIQIYCSDANAGLIKTVPSLIGIVGMICVFHMFANSQMQTTDILNELNILLPASSEQPFVSTSRRYCLTACEALMKAPPKEDNVDSTKYLQGITEVQYLLSRYPLDRTIDHIKQLLYQYKEQSTQSAIRDVFFNYLDGKVVSRNFSWPCSDFVSVREIQTAMNLDPQTFQSIVLGEDPKVKDFIAQMQLQGLEMPPRPVISNDFTATTVPYQAPARVKVEKEEKPKKAKTTSKAVETSKPKVGDEDEHKQKKKKRRFSEEETQNLIDGVKQYGIGHWKNILGSYKFDGRSCVDLKDKWRNIENSKNRNNQQKSTQSQGRSREATSAATSASGSTVLPPFNPDNF